MYRYTLFVGAKERSNGPDKDFIKGFNNTDEAIKYLEKHKDFLLGKKKTYSLDKTHNLYCTGNDGTIEWYRMIRTHDWKTVKSGGEVI
jgi:hypothetical protein